MQVSVLSGIIGGPNAEFARSFPVNLEPVVIDSKISAGQLRTTYGTTPFATGPGVDRGGIVWNGVHYRVMGTKLVSVNTDGSATVIGDVGGIGPVAMDYSFDRLALMSGTALWYYDQIALTQVTDTDLGEVFDMIWVDSYFMTTDGSFIVVTELSDPTSIEPLKYGSAESDPDMITGLLKFREEVYALGRHTIQVFQNVGGNGFPFRTVKGATIPFGCVSATAKCLFADSFAFCGSARNEGIGIYMAGNGSATRVSTKEIDDLLAAELNPQGIILENRSTRGQRRLMVHLHDRTLVLLFDASQSVGVEAWYFAECSGEYRARNGVDVNGVVIVGDTQSGALAILDDESDSIFGEQIEWRFDAGMLYNESRSGIVHAVELIGLPGRQPFGDKSSIFFSVSRDGVNFSNEFALPLTGIGATTQRMQWRPHLRFQNYLSLRFRGFGLNGFARLEAQVEGLAA